MRIRSVGLLLVSFALASTATAAEPSVPLPPGVTLDAPCRPEQTKIVFVAGSNFYKPGEHEYIAACAVLGQLVAQTADICPVLVLDWPADSTSFAGARAVVLFEDGGEKHAACRPERLAQVESLAASGVGLVLLHQQADVPVEQGTNWRALAGATFEKGLSARAHWISEFNQFPDHPTTRGVTPFTIDDGWLFKLRWVNERTRVTPVLRTVSPKTGATVATDDSPAAWDATVAWAYERPAGGRTFAFTGGHLHASFAQEGYRRLLTNAILWAAGCEIPASGAPVALAPEDLDRARDPRGR